MNAAPRKRMHSVAAAAILAFAADAAADPWETGPNGGDDSAYVTPNVLLPYALPQLHDLANVGGSADEDWFRITVEANRSYEVVITNSNIYWDSGRTLRRLDDIGLTELQGSLHVDRSMMRRALRWIHVDAGSEQRINVTGAASDTAGAFYEIMFRETTLFCPRFNNPHGQVSELLVPRAANERGELCAGTAYFLNEDQAVVGTQSLLIGADDINVYALPGVMGLANQKGGAQIAHTCGTGGLKAKLVALEPATGFSFDTVCAPRDQ